VLRIYKLNGERYRAHPECRQSFREDRKLGLIYGPYARKDKNGRVHFLRGPEEASMKWGMCAYCNKKETT